MESESSGTTGEARAAWCTSCGRSLKEGARSCRHCRARVPGVTTTSEPVVVVGLAFAWALATLLLLLITAHPLPSGAWDVWLFPLMMVLYMLPYAFVILQAVYRARLSNVTSLRFGHLMLITSLWVLVWLVFESEPMVDILAGLPLIFFTLAIFASWIFFLLPASWSAWKGTRHERMRKIAGYLLPLPLGVALLVAAASYDVPIRARFELSEGAMLDRVESFERGNVVSRADSELIGLYTVAHISRLDGCVLLQTNNGIDQEAGFAYCRSGRPEAPTEEMDHLKGKWWVYSYFH
jgi:hypothetical protein